MQKMMVFLFIFDIIKLLEEDRMEQKNKLLKRTKWSYSLGGIGRDMTYALVATFFLTYVQYAVGLTKAQFSVIGVILIIGRVWDAVNDPIMGAIIENTRTRWGKFKPWVLIGAVFTAIVIIVMFNWRPMGNAGWNYVIFFAVIYLLWEIAFTMNDIPIGRCFRRSRPMKRKEQHHDACGRVRRGRGLRCQCRHQFHHGRKRNQRLQHGFHHHCSSWSLANCLLFSVKQTVQTTGEIAADGFRVESKEDKVTFKKMFNVIRNNDQLFLIILAMLLYNVGSGILHALGYNFYTWN